MNMNHNHYSRLLIMSVLSFISMYILMCSMVNVFGNVYNNFNQFYMAAIMTAPMVIFELILMGAMYQNKRLNAVIILVSIAALAIFFSIHPPTDRHLGQTIPEIDDPTSRRSDPDVPASPHPGSGGPTTLPDHHLEPIGRNRSDESQITRFGKIIHLRPGSKIQPTFSFFTNSSYTSTI